MTLEKLQSAKIIAMKEKDIIRRDALTAMIDACQKAAIKEKHRASEMAESQAKKDLQILLSEIQKEELARKQAIIDLQNAEATKKAEIEAARQKAYADTVKQIVESISPDLVAALSTKANAELLETATRSMAPYAIAKGESVAETINTLMRGTTLENVISKITKEQ